MTAVAGNAYDYSRDVAQHLMSTASRHEKTAKVVGGNLDKAEKEYLDILSNPKASQAEITKAQMKFQKATMIFQAFMEMMKALDQTLREAIRKLGL
jgi:hypothetical protein